MHKILLLGLGNIGTLLGILLSKRFEVLGVDIQKPAGCIDLPFRVMDGDVTSVKFMRELLPKCDAVVSALPYFLNKDIAVWASEYGKHYFDLTEDIETTSFIRELGKTATGVLVPQCGLAPGLVGIVAADLAQKFTKLRSIEMRVGALPEHTHGKLGYSFTWSPAGVLNEYTKDGEAIHQGKRKTVISLEGNESFRMHGKELEAFYTSGGLGTMCETYEGKVETLNYKTIRYPGHGALMQFLLHELQMREDLEQLETILK